ncbi:glycogen synthase [Salmonella enterica subsp. enterica serovar Dublin]|nr:glycogen synthase [Salmonella enterica subsp. enterica serovar Dublin]
MQVLHVCSEMFPLLKTGGLADVIGALPAAQIADGVDVRVLLPGFPDIRRGIPDAHVVSRRDTFAGKISLLFGHYNGVGIYLIDAPHLYERPGSPYHDTNLYAYTDNVLRFALLGWVGCEMACGLDPFWRPDVVHAHDWHAGLAPAYLAARGRPAKSVFTVHNLAYQGMFYAKHMDDIELPWSFFNMHGLEFNGQLSFLKAGLYYADHITAVSPTYAREITEPQFAYGMEGLLRQRHLEGRLSGILNGVDEKIWNPESDLLLASRYTRDTLEEKAENKRQLQIAMGLKVNDKVPLFAVVSRLTNQKGLDLVLEALPGLLEQGGQLALLGAGRSGASGRVPRGGGGTPRAGWRTDRLSRSFLASHYGRRGRYSGAQSFRTVRLNAVIWLKVWHAASGAAYRGVGRYGLRQFVGKSGGRYRQRFCLRRQ